jgi:TPP-dependent pyruvate/acetoin dehydrogenase alpha subunit
MAGSAPISALHHSPALTDGQRLKLWYTMKLAAACDATVLRLYRQGNVVGGAYTSRGNEATAVGSAFALAADDYLFPMHRDLGAHLVRGQTLRNIFLQQLARGESLTRGRDGTGHYADPALRIYGNVSHLAAMIPVAVGVALASKLRKEGTVVMNYIGDGGSNVGDFHEGLNMAAVMQLPFVLIIENNQFAYSTPNAAEFRGERLSDRAAGYGIPGVTVDGTDVELVYDHCREAVERARSGGGPSIVETQTMRMEGHSASDDASYVPPGMLDQWERRDPIKRYEALLQKAGILDAATLAARNEEIARDLDEASRYALDREYPDARGAAEGVYAP